VPTIPKTLQPHINSAFPEHVCLVGSVLPNGHAQITPRGSTMVFDNDHIALWERGKGSTTAALRDGTKVTVYFRKPQLRADGVLPKGGIARFYGTAQVVKSGPQYEEVWRRLVQPEKDRDPEKKGFAQMLEGWQLNSILNVQSSLPWAVVDSSTDVSGTGEFTDRWNFFGSPGDFSHRGSVSIPFYAGTSNATCLAQAQAYGSAGVASLQKWGCYVSGASMMLPPAFTSRMASSRRSELVPLSR